MKHKILLCSICVFLFFSCKKEKKPTNAQTYPISFKVTGFSQTQVPIGGVGKTKTAALATQATDSIPVQKLVYILFSTGDAHATTLKRYTKGDASFGTITDNVPPGNYIATFIGGSDRLIVEDDEGKGEYTPFYFHYPSNQWDDTFYKRVPITVTSSGINQGVAIDRFTSRLDLIIKDAIPAGTSRITVTFSDTSLVDAKSGLKFYPGTNYTSKTINTADIGKTNYTITMYNLNNIKPFDVSISYYGINPNGPLDTKVIRNVVCKTNTRTILSGDLFTPTNSEFTIAINQDWNTPVTVNF